MKSLFKGLLKGLLKGLSIVVVAAVAVVFAMRFADGPWGMVPGGAFSQAPQSTPVSWAFVKDLDTVEFQLLDPVSSRTSWIAEHDNRIYIPSGYMNSGIGKLWKQWPMRAEKNGAGLLRIDDTVYAVQLVRTKDPDSLVPVLRELARKYMPSQPPIEAMLEEVASNNLWVFELTPRP
jgi:hypothetical protein